MAQNVLALAPAESLGWVHNIHIMAHNGSPLPPVPGNPIPASKLQESQTLMVYAHTCIPTLIDIKEKSINLNNNINSLHPHGCATACQPDRLSCGGLRLAEGHLQGKQYPAQAANHSVRSIDLWPPHDCSQHHLPTHPPLWRQAALQFARASGFHEKPVPQQGLLPSEGGREPPDLKLFKLLSGKWVGLGILTEEQVC